MENPTGLCQCGCGKKTTVPTISSFTKGRIKGQPVRYLSGHQSKGRTGRRNANWKGGRQSCNGYKIIHSESGYSFEHLLVAEKALGRKLPIGAVVHHANGDKGDNRPSNLIICPDAKYHILLHVRMRALADCGHAHWRKCKYCKEYDDINNMISDKHGKIYHTECRSRHHRERYAKNKAIRQNQT